MGETGDQLQRTGSATPPPAHALTTEDIKTNKQACTGKDMFSSASAFMFCTPMC